MKIKRKKSESAVYQMINQIESDFCFLFVGHWLPGAFGEDRKNVSGLVKAFYEAFKNKTNAPALVLKTSGGTVSVMDRTDIVNKIEQIRQSVDSNILPNVYLAYGDFTDEEMNDLYNHDKIKVHVSLTKGEGYGRPLAEAALTSKPIIASKWSGHLDFLNPETSILIDGKLTKVHASSVWKGVINAESEWFSADLGQAIAYMKDVFKDYKKYTEKSRKTYHHMKTNFSFEKMQEKLDSILTTRIPDFPKQATLNLPKLKKIGGVQETPKITLPKLKKVEA